MVWAILYATFKMCVHSLATLMSRLDVCNLFKMQLLAVFLYCLSIIEYQINSFYSSKNTSSPIVSPSPHLTDLSTLPFSLDSGVPEPPLISWFSDIYIDHKNYVQNIVSSN